jgi:hypothetical protein
MHIHWNKTESVIWSTNSFKTTDILRKFRFDILFRIQSMCGRETLLVNLPDLQAKEIQSLVLY